MKITDTIKYAGVNDHKVDLFEGQYPVPNGMSYNSYVILDEKTAVMDTVDAGFTHEWLDNLEQILDGRKPDYLDCPAHGAGSCGKHCQFSESLSGYYGSCYPKGICHDSEFF